MKCGQAYDAYAPDDFYTIASVKGCIVHNYLKSNCSVPVVYECSNCNHMNRIWWHWQGAHSEYDIAQAREMEDKESQRESNENSPD